MTPLMRQYWEIKSAHKDKILLFRMGDFYEMFFDDAVKAAPILGIALTSRNKKSADETPMCGMPHHSVEGHINKLLAAGLKVAICDQVEDPKTAKGIVKRAITRILTPGMVYDPDTLDSSRAHYLACYENSCLAVLDVSTGESFYIPDCTIQEARRLVLVLSVVEIVFAEKAATASDLELAHATESQHSDLSNDHTEWPIAARRLWSYVASTASQDSLRLLKPFQIRTLQGRLQLNSTSLRHLEIFTTQAGESEQSLYESIQRTLTSGGSRLLRQQLSFPWIDLTVINERLELVGRWCENPARLQRLRELLRGIGDLDRRLNRLGLSQCNARDLQSLASSLKSCLEATQFASDFSLLKQALDEETILKLQNLCEKIFASFVEAPPLQTRSGYMVKTGVSPQLDELIDLSENGQKLLQQMEATEKQKTGISSLKIRYNQVFGYYIEVTNVHKDKVPKEYLRKQTLANAERYCTEELLELEKKILSAQTRRFDLEFEIFDSIRKEALTSSSDILSQSQVCAELDLVSSFAWLAIERNYVKPQLGGTRILIKESRHPVVEQKIKNFIPNHIEINQSGVMLITGPNMAGKSTLMRQIALIAVMAQIGSFVPAAACELPVFHQIFTRIGAHDALSQGLSTFMVEMTETANMLKHADEKSLLILDEIGRGTSTHDGFCLAQAILEYLLSLSKSTVFFATHYHELTNLEKNWQRLQNTHMAVAENNGEVEFLHTLRAGPALKSYGVAVAKRAGLPNSIIKRADQLLKLLEPSAQQESQSLGQLSLVDFVSNNDQRDAATSAQISSAEDPDFEKYKSLAEQIVKFEINSKTPVESLQQIVKWQEQISLL